mgnify:CR=1 FL=1
MENNRYKGPCVGSDEETEINKMQKRLEKNEVIRLYSTIKPQNPKTPHECVRGSNIVNKWVLNSSSYVWEVPTRCIGGA